MYVPLFYFCFYSLIFIIELANIRKLIEAQFWEENPTREYLNYYDFFGLFDEKEESISDYSISDECDGDQYNNQGCI